jgi:hypothetical protein
VSGSESKSKICFGFGSSQNIQILSDSDPQHCVQHVKIGENYQISSILILNFIARSWNRKKKIRLYKTTSLGSSTVYRYIISSVVDPDPQGSETFSRIRIHKSRLWIRIRIQNCTKILLKIIHKISTLLIMTLKIH